jgi:hypothetical protein
MLTPCSNSKRFLEPSVEKLLFPGKEIRKVLVETKLMCNLIKKLKQVETLPILCLYLVMTYLPIQAIK